MPSREPFESEREFFLNNRDVGGYAAEDNAVVLNPFSIRSPQEKQAIAKNEALRVLLRSSQTQPQFALTPEQSDRFKGYSQDPKDIQHTLFARIVTGDPSAGATPEQVKHAQQILSALLRERLRASVK